MDVKKLFGDISETYDLLNRVLSFGTDKRWRRKTAVLLPHGKETRILDLATGTLDLALIYLQQGPGNIYGADIAHPMLKQGQTKISSEFHSRIHLVCADGLKLPFPDHFFDGAMCGYGMRNLPDNTSGLQELHRVLKPSASLVFLEFFRPETILAKIFAKTYGKYVIPTVGRILSGNKEAYTYLHNSVCDFYSLEEYKTLLKETGFSISHSRNLTGGISSLILAVKS